MKKIKGVVVIFIIALILLVISGADECPQGGNGGETQASQYGVDFALKKGVGQLTQGSTINLGDTFTVYVVLENYDDEQKEVELCILISILKVKQN